MMYKLLILSLAFVLSSCQKEESISKEFSQESSLLWGFALEGFPDKKILLDLQQTTTLNSQITLFYLQWPPIDAQVLPTKEVRLSLVSIWESGAVPCITWEPMYYSNDKRTTIASKDIIEGRYNSYLDAFSNEIKALNFPVIVRFAHEMNLQEYHWGDSTAAEYGPKSQESYISMYQYVYDYLKKQGVNNTLWAFCPNADSVPYHNDPNASWNLASGYYPGDEYVDILGMDGYDWGPDNKISEGNIAAPQISFEQIFSNLFHQLRTLNQQKPIIVFETASAYTGKKRETWIKNALQTAKNWQLQGMIWFQAKKEKNWLLDASFKDSVTEIKQATSVSQPWAKHLMQ